MTLDNGLLDQSKCIIITETQSTTMSSIEDDEDGDLDQPASKKGKPTSKKGVKKRLREFEKVCLELSTENRKL
jgi:hypothetical protein